MKTFKTDSAMIYERAEDKSMLLRLTTKAGTFEFEFDQACWHGLGEAAKWFEKREESK